MNKKIFIILLNLILLGCFELTIIDSLEKPKSLKFRVSTVDGIILKWDSVENKKGYKIYRNGKLYGDVIEEEFKDRDVVVGNVYNYRVKAYSSGIESGEALITVTKKSISQIKKISRSGDIIETIKYTKWDKNARVSEANVIVKDIIEKIITNEYVESEKENNEDIIVLKTTEIVTDKDGNFISKKEVTKENDLIVAKKELSESDETLREIVYTRDSEFRIENETIFKKDEKDISYEYEYIEDVTYIREDVDSTKSKEGEIYQIIKMNKIEEENGDLTYIKSYFELIDNKEVIFKRETIKTDFGENILEFNFEDLINSENSYFIENEISTY